MLLNKFRSQTVLNVWHTSPQVEGNTHTTIRRWRPLQKSADIQWAPSPLYHMFTADTETRAHHSQLVKPQLGVTLMPQLRCCSVARKYSARHRNCKFNIVKPKVFRSKGFQRVSAVARVNQRCYTILLRISVELEHSGSERTSVSSFIT